MSMASKLDEQENDNDNPLNSHRSKKKRSGSKRRVKKNKSKSKSMSTIKVNLVYPALNKAGSAFGESSDAAVSSADTGINNRDGDYLTVNQEEKSH